MATVETEDVPLSPGTESKFKFLLQSVRYGEAKLQKDSDGKLQIVYTNEKTIPLSHVDCSKAHSIQTGGNSRDVRTRVDVCLQMIEVIKRNRAPSGVVIDKTKVVVTSMGRYAEGKQFQRLKEVLGKGNCAGDIVVIRDFKSGTEQALKTVMISEFSTDEVRAWMELGESDTFPSLYLFRLEGNQVVFHMEKIEHGVTMDDLVNVHMTNLQQNAPELMRPFSLCMFHGLLSAVTEMHDKKWAHRDLHGRNVMVTKDTMMLKVLDFGKARRLKEGIDFNHDALKNDVLNAIRLFCGLYIGQDFQNNHTLEQEIKNETLNQVLLDTSHLADRERKELLQLITMTYQVTRHPQQVGYGSAVPVMENIEDKIYPDKKMDVLKQAAAHLFPDFYEDFGLHAVPEAQDTHTRPEAGEATGLPAEFSTSVEDAVAVQAMDEAEEMAVETNTQHESDAIDADFKGLNMHR